MTIQGNNYIFEIYQDVGQASANVAIQGFNPGNYDICVSSNMRDISPQQAVLWIESVAQQNAQKPPVSNPGNYDLQGQVWMVYQSASVTTMQKVELGTPTTLHFTRPPLADQIGYLYFIYVNTQTDADAKNFINNFLSGVFGTAIKKQALSVINTAIDLNKIEKSLVSEQKNAGTVIDQENIAAGKNKVVSAVTDSSPMTLSNTLAQEVLSGTVPANIARLQDPTKNITGYLLGVDVFTSFGGQLPPISYYQLTPATISFDTLANLLNQYIDSTKIKSLRSNTNTANTKNKIDAQSQISDAMNAQITTWFGDYVSKGSQAVQAEIVAFLSKYGSATLFDSKGALTKGGLNRVKSFVNGLVSLANPPILYSSIITQSPAYAVITGMPGASGSVATTTTVAASKAIQS